VRQRRQAQSVFSYPAVASCRLGPGFLLRGSVFCLSLLCLSLLSFSYASQAKSGSDSSQDGQQQLNKSLGYLKSGNWPKAAEATELAVAGAPDVKTCLDALAQMEKYGAQANKARRACLTKALNLATTHEDLEEVAFKARQAGCFDVSKQALDSLVGSTTSISQLTQLASKAQQAAMPDVAHMAMAKAYKLIDNQPDALDFIQQAHGLGLDDLSRDALKDLIDDQENVVDMMHFLPTIEKYNMSDMVRYLLKTGLDKAKTTEEMLAVYDNAQKYDQADIVKVAQYRGRKMVLLKKLKDEDANRAAVAAEKAKNDPANVGDKPAGF
jgi:tetratricopeptide (TPR) repeat protein